jgi:hypothetical protein
VKPVRLLLGCLLAWQVLAGAWALAGNLRSNAARGYGQRLMLDTVARVRLLLGADFVIYELLREQVPADGWVLSRVAPLPDRFDEASRRDFANLGTLNRLRHLLYPSPFLARSMPDPVAVAEQLAQPGSSYWMLVLPGDPVPAGRPGWSHVTTNSRCELWRFQKA